MQPLRPRQIPLPRGTTRRTLCVVAALGLLQAAAVAQAPPPDPDAARAGSLLVLIEDRPTGARILGVAPKTEPYTTRIVHSASTLTLTLRDGQGNPLCSVDVDVPTNHGLCRLNGNGATDPNGDRWLLAARVPDFGDRVAQLDLQRTIDGAQQYAMSLSGLALRAAAPAGGTIVQTIRLSGSTATKFDLVILGDGYLATQQAQFNLDANELVNHLFATIEPYRTYQNYFNVHTVLRFSNGLVTQNSQGASFTAYGAVIGNPVGVQPLALGGFNQAMLDAIQAPDVEQGAVLILANVQNRYGGIASFNQYGMGTTNRVNVPGQDVRLKFPEIMEHELGHAYANLHDEYPTFGGGNDSPSNPDHPEANVTNRPPSFGNPPLKWSYWANRLTPNYSFIGGAGFQGGIWHPNPACMMNFLDDFHCPVCREEIVRRTYSIGGLSPMANIAPAAINLTLSDLNFADLSYTDATPTGGRYEWWIDGVQLTNTGVPITTNLRVYGAVLGYGPHAVEARIYDRSLETPSNPSSEFVRQDPGNALRGTRTWNIDVQPPIESRRLSYQRGNADGFYSGLGKHLAVLGDVNLDGVRDFAYGTNVHVHIVSGATRLPIATLNANGTGTGPVPFVAGVGAINADAFPDIAIGTPGSSNRIDLYSGLDQSLIFGFAPTLSANTTFGGDIAALGRIDGDTRDDFAVAFEGAAPAVKVYAGNNGSVIRTYTGAAGAAGAVTTTAIQDLNGDGKRELVVTFQRAGGTDIAVHSPATGTTLASFTQSGEVYEAAAAFDILGDGVAELVFGAPSHQGSRGRVRVFAINVAGGTLTSLTTVDGVAGDYYYGRSVAAAGDYDMDGANDFVVGCPGLGWTTSNPGTFGRIEIVSGRTGYPIESRVDGLQSGTQFGIAVANFGDTNDDGLEDIAVGSPSLGVNPDGAVRIYSPASPTLTADTNTLSTLNGGVHNLSIDLASSLAGQSYLVLGSLTGTIPGQVIGDRRLPLIVDWYFGTTLGQANVGIFVNTAGVLDAAGNASASLVVPPGLLVGLAGLKAYHAALAINATTATASTNAVPLLLVQ